MRAAITTIRHITIVVALVDIESTYQAPCPAMIQHARQLFPALPITLTPPWIDGFSRAYAPFELDQLTAHINADTIARGVHGPAPATGELSF
ncbi:MAG: hypothetical protein WC810_01125 [Janthinobacterium sp.]